MARTKGGSIKRFQKISIPNIQNHSFSKIHKSPSQKYQPNCTGSRFHPKAHILKELRLYKSSEVTSIHSKRFNSLVNKLTQSIAFERTFYTKDALDMMKEAAEIYIISMFEDCYHCSVHARRSQVSLKDLKLARRIRGEFTVFPLSVIQ